MNKPEIKVGLFVVFSLISLFILVTQLSRFNIDTSDGYTLNATLDNANGLDRYSKVKLYGVPVGYVEDIHLEANVPMAKLIIKKDVKIPKDSSVTLSQEGLLGAIFVEIKPGQSSEYFVNNDVMSKADINKNVNSASSGIVQVTRGLNSLIEKLDEAMPNVIRTTEHLKEISENINKFVKTDIKEISGNMNKFVKKDLNNILKKTSATIDNLNLLITENRKDIKVAVKSIKNLSEKGDKFVSKMDSSILELSKSKIYFRGMIDRFSDRHYTEGVVGLRYVMNRYMTDLSIKNSKDLRRGKIKDRKTRYLVNLEVGKSFHNLILHGGIIDSTFGVGLDYMLLKDKLGVGLDLYDLAAENRADAKKPNFRASLEYHFLKDFIFYVGYNSIFDRDRDIFAGFGTMIKLY